MIWKIKGHQVEYEGEWRDGHAWGQGKLAIFNSEDKMILEYDGMWRYDMWHGSGRLKKVDGTSYDGDWKHGLRHGKGAERLPNG